MSTRKTRNPYEAERAAPFTNKEMEVMCGVTAMTLHLWRKGAPTKTGPLKTTPGRGREVLFPVRATLAWLERNAVPIFVHPDDLQKPRAVPRSLEVKKPGPKPKATALTLARDNRPLAS